MGRVHCPQPSTMPACVPWNNDALPPLTSLTPPLCPRVAPPSAPSTLTPTSPLLQATALYVEFDGCGLAPVNRPHPLKSPFVNTHCCDNGGGGSGSRNSRSSGKGEVAAVAGDSVQLQQQGVRSWTGPRAAEAARMWRWRWVGSRPRQRRGW